MTLKDYYKEKVYNTGYEDAKNGREPLDDNIYFEDEMDFYICADYYSMYVGDSDSWTQKDLDFLNALGFNAHDFEEVGEDEVVYE